MPSPINKFHRPSFVKNAPTLNALTTKGAREADDAIKEKQEEAGTYPHSPTHSVLARYIARAYALNALKRISLPQVPANMLNISYSPHLELEEKCIKAEIGDISDEEMENLRREVAPDDWRKIEEESKKLSNQHLKKTGNLYTTTKPVNISPGSLILANCSFCTLAGIFRDLQQRDWSSDNVASLIGSSVNQHPQNMSGGSIALKDQISGVKEILNVVTGVAPKEYENHSIDSARETILSRPTGSVFAVHISATEEPASEDQIKAEASHWIFAKKISESDVLFVDYQLNISHSTDALYSINKPSTPSYFKVDFNSKTADMSITCLEACVGTQRPLQIQSNSD